jgi:hypothetical protein
MRNINFSNIRRNPSRFRRKPARTRVKTNIHTLGMVEALEARRRGLDKR